MSKLSDLLNSQPVTARQAADIAANRDIQLPYGTIAAYWSGRHGRPSAQTLERLAEVLPFSINQLQRAAWGRTAPVAKWTPPAEIQLLTERQRLAIDELIRSIAATAQGASDEDASTTTPAPDSKANGEAGASRTTTTGAARRGTHKAVDATPPNEGTSVDSQDQYVLAARKGITQREWELANEPQTEDENQDAGTDDPA